MSDRIRNALSRAGHPVTAFIVLALLCTATVRASGADDNGAKLLFAQRDEVQAFNTTNGKGFQTGTTSGTIVGTSFVSFQLTIVGPPGTDGALPITFSNKVIITDLDGDQLFFDNNGTGKFHVGIPGDPFAGVGGPLTGTYVLTGGTGKYASWKIGTTFDYRAIMTNPPNGALGNVYVQVTFHDRNGN